MGAAESEPGRQLARPQAFRDFYERTLPVVYSYLFHRCGGERAVAEDLAQETFMAAVREVRRDAPITDEVPWILGVARHKLIDHYRREERRERKLRLAFRAASVEVQALPFEGDASREKALAAMARIPASQRVALGLRYLDEMSVSEVARALDKSVHATESLIARGRESFRRTYLEVLR